MTQPAAPVSNPPPLTYTGEIIQWTGSYLSNPMIIRVVRVAAIPLSLLATYYAMPYLILDSTTTLIGVGCAALINTVALRHFHTLIKDWWDRRWVQDYPIPELPARAAQSEPAQAPVRPEPSQAELKYTQALEALDLAIHNVKIATEKRDSVDQGQEAIVNGLRSTYLENKTELIECAETKKNLIEELIQFSKEVEAYRNTAEQLQKALKKAEASAGADADTEKAKAIIAIDVLATAGNIQRAFQDTLISLNKQEGPYGIRYSQATELETFNRQLESYRAKLKILERTLKDDRKNLERLRKTEEELEALQAKHLNQAHHIDPPSDVTRSPEKKSKLETARVKRDSVIESLEAKMKERLRYIENIAKHTLHGIPGPEDSIDDDPLKFASLHELTRIESEIRNLPANDDLAIERILTKLEQDLKEILPPIQDHIHLQIGKLKGWGEKFHRQMDKAGNRLQDLDKRSTIPIIGGMIDKLSSPSSSNRDANAEERKEFHKALCLKLQRTFADLENLSHTSTSRYTKEAEKPFEDFPKLSHTRAWEQLLIQRKLKSDNNSRYVNTTPKNIVKLFLDNLIHSNIEDPASLIEEYHALATEKIQLKNSEVNTLEKIRASLTHIGARATPLDQLISLFQLNSPLLQSIRINVQAVTQLIRDSDQKIFDLREERKKRDLRSKQIGPVIEQRRSEIEALKEDLAQFEEKTITPLQREAARTAEEYISLEIERSDLLARSAEIAQQLVHLRKEKEKVSQTDEKNQESQKQLSKSIELLDQAIKLIPAMKPVHGILQLESDERTKPVAILKACESAFDAWHEAEKARPMEISACVNGLREAVADQRKKAEERDTAFASLLREKAQHNKDRINTLRVGKYRSLISASETVQAFYNAKIANLSRDLRATPGNERNAMDSQQFEVLEKKIHLAAERIEMDSDPANINRLHLAEHTLLRRRAEKKWKAAYGGEKEKLRKELIEAIESEQKLVFLYYSSKIARDRNSLTKRVLKANFAVLNLILDRMRIEISALPYEERKQYKIFHILTNYLNQAESTDEGKAFNLAAYGKPIPDAPKSWWTRNLPFISQDKPKEIPPNPFIKRVVEKLHVDSQNTDQNAHASLHKLTNFLEEINGQSKDLHTDKTTLAYDEKPPSAALIGSKINILQLSLRKPFVDQAGFAGKYKTDYLPAKRVYKIAKYVEKISYAVILDQSTKANPLYKEAERLREQEEARRTEERRVGETGQRERAAAIARRNEAMATGSGIEKLSYLIPTIALWILYGLAAPLSPILTSISLSLRVSQNALLISSATNLFVHCFFPRLRTEPTPSLTPERVSAN